MTMWADNIKFVKDIIDSKYHKIDHAVAEVENDNSTAALIHHFQITESSEALLHDAKCSRSKEQFTFAVRTLELVQPSEIEQLLQTIIDVS